MHTKYRPRVCTAKMAASSIDVSSLLSKYQLKEEHISKQVSDKLLDKISRTCCQKWRSLHPWLDMKGIVGQDIDELSTDGEGKRKAFLEKWKSVKGSEATYKKLVCALLEIECKDDAESVLKLIKESIVSAPPSTSTATSKFHLDSPCPRL